MVSKYIIYWLIMCYATLYAFMKQRQEYGCSESFFTTKRQCIDENSVHIKGTKSQDTDTLEELNRKMISTLSYHEKSGIWKICLIMANVLVFFVYMFVDIQTPLKTLIPIHLMFLAIQYFYFNFINYHHFSILKSHGMETLKRINHKCFNKSVDE